MSQQAAKLRFSESRYMLSQGRLAKAAECATKALAAEPEAPLLLFVAGSIEAARYWMSLGDRNVAFTTVKRIFDFPGPYEIDALKPERLEPAAGVIAEQHQTAALQHLTRAGQLADGLSDKELIEKIALTASELDKSWTHEMQPPRTLVADELCLLDISIERAAGVAWINDLPECPIVMLEPHWARLSSAKPSTVAVPVDIGKGADPILEQLWRRGSDCDLIVVTGNAAQVRAAEGLRNLSGELPDPQKAPIKRKLRLVKPAAKLPEWQVPKKAGSAAQVVPLPSATGNQRPPLFSTAVAEDVFVDLTPVEVAVVDTGSVLSTSANGYRRLVSKKLGFGGEGVVYLTDAGDVCKAFQPEKATSSATSCRERKGRS